MNWMLCDVNISKHTACNLELANNLNYIENEREEERIQSNGTSRQ